MNTADKLRQFENASRDGWDALAFALNTDEASNLSNMALNLAQYYARLGYYLLARKGTGCGDRPHDDAMAYAEKHMWAVRKLLATATRSPYALPVGARAV